MERGTGMEKVGGNEGKGERKGETEVEE